MKRLFYRFWLIFVLGWLALGAQVSAAPLKIIMTVDWEGADLKPINLKAMKRLRADFPEVTMVHFLNAAYFTKPSADQARVAAAIKSVLRPGDQLGLHIHGWQSLFWAAGVEHRRAPVWTPGGKPLTAADCRVDCGFEVPMAAYDRDEIRKVIHYSVDVLSRYGLGHARFFRAGGWMMAPQVAEALALEGFVYDSSAVPVNFIEAVIPDYPLIDMLKNLWPDVNELSQPYRLPAGIWEFPDNGALADYMTGPQMVAVVQHNLAAQQGNADNVGRWVVVGFHQETADDWQNRVRELVNAVREMNRKEPDGITWAVFPSQET